MSKFSLFSYLKWRNDKTSNIASSSYKKYFDENVYRVGNYPWLDRYISIKDAFSLVRSTMILKAINNKLMIEEGSELYNEKVLKKESTYKVIHERLPYLVHDEKRIYVPFLNEESNLYYDRKLDELSKLPHSSLKKNCEEQSIDAFDLYNLDFFDSSFTRLIKVYEFKESVAFYDIELETIFVIDDQGRLEQDIPLFDSKVLKKDKSDIIAHLHSLMSYYFNDDKFGFIDALYKYNFISKVAYNFILNKEHKKEKDR